MEASDHADEVRLAAQHLAIALQAATDAGVSEAILFPTLIGVFKEANMMPEGFDNILGLLGLSA